MKKIVILGSDTMAGHIISDYFFNTFNVIKIKESEIFYNELNENAKSIFNYNVITHEEFPNDNKRKLSSYVSNILNANIISIFINVKILRYSDNKTYYRTIKLIGDSIKKHLL